MNIVNYDRVASLIGAGAIGVMPTDTVYGLVASAHDSVAVGRLYATKKREQKPGTLIAASIDQLVQLGVPQGELDMVAQYWPNPLSAVLTLAGREYLTQGVGTLAMRVVADERTRDLLLLTGPLITSSANQPGEPPATTIEEAVSYFGDSIDFYVDGGEIAGTLPSTIIRPHADGIEILRQGSVTL